MHISNDYPFSNRAASYGDGCFTTIAVEEGKAELLSQHIERLKLAGSRLNIELSKSDWLSLRAAIQETAQSKISGIVKVILGAGNASRGYLRTSECSPQCYIQWLPPVEHYKQWRDSGISVGVSPFKLSQQTSLAGIKHLNRLEQVLIKENTSTVPNYELQDVIVLDEQNMIVEVSAGNLFWCANSRWFTPELTYSGVEGVMRNFVLACFERNNIKVNTVRSNLSALKFASDVFICNSLMKIVPVNNIWFTKEQMSQYGNGRLSQIAELVGREIKMESV